MPTDRVREATPPGFLVGRSVHSVEETRLAGTVDYLIAGTMFATESKPEKTGTDLLGVDGLTAIVRATSAPVLAVGGLTLDRVSAVMRTGAAGLAAIGLFLGPSGPPMNDRLVPLEVLVHDIRARV
jgi:thiamine monophosphate synthase